MTAREESHEKEKVERLVRELNAAWLENRVDDLGPMFHEEVVMMAPGAAGSIAGREAGVDSFRQFLKIAKVHDFEILDLRIDVFGPTAIAALSFDIRYEIDGNLSAEKGVDLLVLSRLGDEWQVVWRTQTPAT